MMLLHKAVAHPLLTLAQYMPAPVHLTPPPDTEEHRLIAIDAILLQLAAICAARGAAIFYKAQRRAVAGERIPLFGPFLWMLLAAIIALGPTFMNAWNCPVDYLGPQCLDISRVLKKLLFGPR